MTNTPALPPEVKAIAAAWDNIPPAIRAAIAGLVAPYTK
jgi:hypothetical protein